MGDDSEWQKLPTDEKCQHKVWKARVAGYEASTKLFNGLDEKSKEFNVYGPLIKKFVTDSNAVAQEKGLDAVNAFVTNASSSICARTCNEVVTGIVTKCLNAREKTKDKGMDIIMLYIEAEKPDIVQECLMLGMENKQPKVVVGCVQTITMSLRDFGSKVIQVKPLLKLLPKLLNDRDKNVREETKVLVIELFRWIGQALKPQMGNFNPIQVQEFEAEFEKIPPGKPVQSRFMRSQQDLKAKMEEKAAATEAGGDEGGEAEEEEAIDPFDLCTPVDMLALLPKDFFEKIEAKKWQERKEVLEAAQKLAESPRLEQGDYSSLIRVVLKVVAKDSNVMLVALGGKIVTGVATGLRKKYQPYAVQTVSTILDKFKEKKLAVVAALREAIDASYQATSLEAIMEDAVAALENKNPSIKTETASFLGRCFARCTTASLPKKMLKGYCPSLLKTVNDTDPGVREASFLALGTAMKVVSEKHMGAFLADVDPIKMAKIVEACENAVLLNAKGEPRGGAAAAPAKKAAPVAAPKAEEPKPVKRPGVAKSAAGAAAKKGPVKAKAPVKKGKVVEKEESALGDEAVEEKAQTFLPGDTITNLASSNWKERLAAMEGLIKVVSSTSKDDIPCQVCIRVACKKPGLKETNFQVLKLKLELIAHLGRNSKFSKRSAEFCLADIVDKLGDVKNGGAAKDCLTSMGEAVGLEFVCAEAMGRAFEAKNPKNQQEALIWLATAVVEFGLKINVKGILPVITKALAHTNPGVRGAAIALLGQMYMYMGDQLRMLFDNEKPALLTQIDAEFAKMKGVSPPAPTRRLISAAGQDDDDEDEEEKGEDGEGDAAPQDLVPRNDISEKITEAILTELTDKNWKVRGEALDKVKTMLSDAKFITPALGSLPEALKLRLGESNKVLQMKTIEICQTLSQALGQHSKQHIRVIGPGLLACLADSKPSLREKVVTCLNAWVDHTTLLPLVESEAIMEALMLENPFCKAELLGWLAIRLPPHKQLPAELKACIPPVLEALTNRNADVRKKAVEALVPIMIHTGYDSMLKAVGKCKPASKDQIQPLLEKARENLPAKPQKVKKAAPAAAASAPKAVVRPAAKAAAKPESSPEPEEEEEEPEPVAMKAEPKAVKGKAKPKGKAPAAASTKKKGEEEDCGPIMTMTVSKAFREKDKLCLKWNFLESGLTREYIEQLRMQMEKNFNKSVIEDLFHKDFKNHIKVIEQLIKCIETQGKETLNNLDLVLKWTTLRFYDTNPSMLNKCLDYLQRLFQWLADQEYRLTESDAFSFIPYLLIKSGENKDNVRRDVRNILKLIVKVFPASRVFSYLIEGLKPKAAKQRIELLEELGCLIEAYGMNVCQPSPGAALKIIAQYIGERDNSIRNAALNTICEAYFIVGEGVYKLVGNLKDKEMSYLDERIKRASKNREKTEAAQAKAPPAPPQKRPSTAAAPAKTSALQRPSTAAAAPAKTPSLAPAARPNTAPRAPAVPKAYQLDIELDDYEPVMPSLEELDVDSVMVTITKPKTMGRPASPALSSRLVGSVDASSSISSVINQISSVDINTCIRALAQIDEVMKDTNKVEVLSDHVDNLLMMVTVQSRMGINKHILDHATDPDQVIRLYRILFSTLIHMFSSSSSLGHLASTNSLKDLLACLLSVLLDPHIEQHPDGPQMIKTLNLTIIKVINMSDPTNLTCANISLLRECLQSETCSSKFMELVTKCLWKTMNQIPESMGSLNCDRVLYEAHLFFQKFPSSSLRSKPSLDLPIRSLKTLLHNLTKLKGHKILSHTGLISASETSEVEAYLHMVLAKTSAGSDGDKLKVAQKNKKLSKTHELLSEIFKKIGTKENTREGLNDLFDFKKKYPEADMNPFLKKTAPSFQKYISNMLTEIEEERAGSKATGVYPSPSPSDTTNPSEESALDVDFYREKLRELRAKCGLDNAQGENGSDSKAPMLAKSSFMTSTSEEPEESALPPAPKPEEPVRQSVDVSNLKARLERIKKMANS